MWRQQSATAFPITDEPAWPAQPYSLAIPNRYLREASSVAEMDAFFAIGEAWAHMVAHFLPENPSVLDIGCGCAKLARFLYMNPRLTYVGVDIFLPAILWARKTFGALAGDRFRFEHYDGYSALYNPQGRIQPSQYRLPCEDASIDAVVCASLFTHLLQPDCVHYLDEIRRVLKPGGKAIISIHVQPASGTEFSGDETRIDISPRYFVELARKAGLTLAEEVGACYGQHVVVFRRP